MKLFFLFLCVVGLACSACKLETSLATQNGNATPPQASPSSSVAQPEQTRTNCSLTKADAPVVNGLKLGMTPEEVLALFPGSKDDPELRSQLLRPASQLGVSNFVVHPENLEPNDKFAAFSQFTFNVLDGRVSSLNIGYNGPAYSDVDEFVTKFVKGTKLPPADQWQAYTGMDNQLKILTCKDFEVRVFAGGKDGNLNYVSLTDLEADRRIKDRRAKARPQASPTPVAKSTPNP
jgi:hypothetical protein